MVRAGAAPEMVRPFGKGARSSAAGEAGSSFEAIFSAHYGRIVRLLARLVRTHSQAEELASEVFWKLYNQPAAAALWSNVGGWLYRTATHAGIDAIRASDRRKQYEAAAVRDRQLTTEGPLDELLRAENRERVRTVLGGMRPAQAQMLLMRESGASYKEIAEAIEAAPSGIGTLLTRAEEEFRKRYLHFVGSEEKQ